MRYVMRLLLTAVCVVVGLPAAAQAQAHLQVVGGVTDAADRQPFFGVGLGVRLGAVEVGIEGGRFSDVLAEGVLDALNDLQRDRGLPVQAIASVPVTYALASVRLVPGVGPIRPFVFAGGGLARLEPRVNIVVQGISFGDVFGLTSMDPIVEPMAAAGAGLRVDGGRVHVEGGYRYVVIFSDFRTLNVTSNSVVTRVHGVYGAVGFRF